MGYSFRISLSSSLLTPHEQEEPHSSREGEEDDVEELQIPHVTHEYLRTHLFDKILRENPETSNQKSLQATNDEILEDVARSRGGSTSVTAILIDRQKRIVANVGDSRAILCRGGALKQLTTDHEPQKEKELVESRDGFVSEMPGNLAMTRAFGDGKLKEHITSEPDVRVEMIDPNADEFFIVASDGLWKVMSNEEAFDHIREFDDAQETSEELIREALARGSNSDLEVESDSLNAILWTRHHSKVPWRMKLISNAIETLSKSFRKVTFNHISREINLIADGLAKAGVLRAVNFSTFLQPPGMDPSSEA
ncbi:Phosphatase 2c, putative [Theobroma cacao]|uniref:Phosphatase 2c, putative n=1 Tax=Theobroma cacao TaxID=3641 RepID=A0A061G8Q5_THECC|nr:Phosphatase 2c, putative [Theobroma cacao]